MSEIKLVPMTKALTHKFFQGFETDPCTYANMEDFKPYIYDKEWVKGYFMHHRIIGNVSLAVMLSNEPIGEVVLKKIDNEKRECTLGIHLKNDNYKNKGIGTKAIRLALQYAFNEMNMLAVNADSILKNTRSQHVLEKVGFKHIGEDDTNKYYRCEKSDFKYE